VKSDTVLIWTRRDRDNLPIKAARPTMPLVIHNGVGVLAGLTPACCITEFQLQPAAGVQGHL